MRLTTRGRAFLVLAAVTWVSAFPLGIPLLTWCAVVLAATVVVALVSQWLVHPAVEVKRSINSGPVEAGESFVVRLVISRPVVWREDLPSAIVADASGVGAEGFYQAVARRRGVHSLGPLIVTRQDPWGLVEAERTAGQPTSLTVFPRLVSIQDVPLEAGIEGEASRHTGSGQDDIIARPYVSGDEIKRLHWKATARRGELMVRQEEDREHPRLVIVLDHESSVHGIDHEASGDLTSPSLEWAISMAASLMHHHTTQGHEARLVGPGHLDLARDLESRRVLAELDPLGDPDRVTFDPVNADTVIVLTGRVDPRSAEALVGSVTAREVLVLATQVSDAAADIFVRAGWRLVVRGTS